MRDLIVVIDNMLDVIPSDNENLVSRLRKLQVTVSYTAPELMVTRWCECANILNDEIPESEYDWHEKLADIFSDKRGWSDV